MHVYNILETVRRLASVGGAPKGRETPCWGGGKHRAELLTKIY